MKTFHGRLASGASRGLKHHNLPWHPHDLVDSNKDRVLYMIRSRAVSHSRQTSPLLFTLTKMSRSNSVRPDHDSYAYAHPLQSSPRKRSADDEFEQSGRKSRGQLIRLTGRTDTDNTFITPEEIEHRTLDDVDKIVNDVSGRVQVYFEDFKVEIELALRDAPSQPVICPVSKFLFKAYECFKKKLHTTAGIRAHIESKGDRDDIACAIACSHLILKLEKSGWNVVKVPENKHKRALKLTAKPTRLM